MRATIVFRPITLWPGTMTRNRTRSPFSASYSATLDLLNRELWHLGAREVMLQLALQEGDIRRDGMLRAHSRPAHPGVILAFQSKHGPLQYATDEFTDWESNLRAIALGLEALRKVDRYGITKRGEQYAGWKALPPATDSAERGRWLIEQHGGEKQALRATHPDHGGNPDDFRAVRAARRA